MDNPTQYDNIIRQLRGDEGSKLKPYRDNSKHIGFEGRPGKLTIGIGRNLDDVGISEDEETYLCRNDVNKATVTLISHLEWVKQLDEVRAAVLINMTFNMGIGEPGRSGLLAFTNTLAMIRAGRNSDAKQAMLNSLWAKQVGHRAVQLANQIESGVWQF